MGERVLNRSERGYILTEEEAEEKKRRISRRRPPYNDYRNTMVIGLKTFRKLLKRNKEEKKEEKIKNLFSDLVNSINNNDRLDKIERLLEKIADKDPVVIRESHITETANGTDKKHFEKDEDSFIPDINIEDMKLNKSSSIRTEKSDMDTKKVSEALSNI